MFALSVYVYNRSSFMATRDGMQEGSWNGTEDHLTRREIDAVRVPYTPFFVVFYDPNSLMFKSRTQFPFYVLIFVSESEKFYPILSYPAFSGFRYGASDHCLIDLFIFQMEKDILNRKLFELFVGLWQTFSKMVGLEGNLEKLMDRALTRAKEEAVVSPKLLKLEDIILKALLDEVENRQPNVKDNGDESAKLEAKSLGDYLQNLDERQNEKDDPDFIDCGFNRVKEELARLRDRDADFFRSTTGFLSDEDDEDNHQKQQPTSVDDWQVKQQFSGSKSSGKSAPLSSFASKLI